MTWGTPETKALIEAIEPHHFEKGSYDDLIYRWNIAQDAKSFNTEVDHEGEEYALERLPGFLNKYKDYKALGLLERMKEQILKHAAYLRSQEVAAKPLWDKIMGASQ